MSGKRVSNEILHNVVYITLVSIMLVMTASAVLVFGSPNSVSTNMYSVKKMVIAYSAYSKGYVGSPLDLEINVKGYKVRIHIDKGGAYDAAVALIGGVYDEGIHKWVAITGGHSVDSKDWTGPLAWEQYHITLIKDKGMFNGKDFIAKEEGDMYVFEAGAYVTFKVVHCTWWCISKEIKYDNYAPHTVVYIPKDSIKQNK